MKQKRKSGFTLIELLAVIVILAIIALIAVPVIMNIISKANESAFKDTAYGIIQAGELYYAEQLLEPNGMMSDVTFDLPDERLQIKGDIPQGTMTVTKEGKISIAVSNGRYCVTKGIEDKDVKVTEDIANCGTANGSNEGLLSKLATEYVLDSTIDVNYETICDEEENCWREWSEETITSQRITVNACAKSGICPTGTPFAIKVNDNQIYKFYVISDNGSEVTLIMDRNLGDETPWTTWQKYEEIYPWPEEDDEEEAEYSIEETEYEEDFVCGYSACNNIGPITALNYLNSQTATWTNIPAIENYTYINNENGNTNTYGYQKLKIINGAGVLTTQDSKFQINLEGTSRARLLTVEDYSALYYANSNETPKYLYTNLIGSEIPNSWGYWFLDAMPTEQRGARYVQFYDGYAWGNVYNINIGIGIRPVITLTK